MPTLLKILFVQIYFTVFSLLNYGMLCFSKPKLQKAGSETAFALKMDSVYKGVNSASTTGKQK